MATNKLLQDLDTFAIDEFQVFLEQTGKRMCTAPYKCFEAISRLYCFTLSFESVEIDLQLPLKPYKFIKSSWVKATLYQVINEGLSALNMAHEKLGLLEYRATEIASAMAQYMHCAIVLQDNLNPIAIGFKFLENVTALKKLAQNKGAIFKPAIALIKELDNAIRDAKNCSPTLRQDILLALADVSKRINFSNQMWMWVAEMSDSLMSTIGANSENEINTQTLNDAHKAACVAFRLVSITKMYINVISEIGTHLASMDELVAVTTALEASEKQEEIHSIMQVITENYHSTESHLNCCSFYQYHLDYAQDKSEAAATTRVGWLQVTVVCASLLNAAYFNEEQGVFAELEGKASHTVIINTRNPVWNYTFPMIPFHHHRYQLPLCISIRQPNRGSIPLGQSKFVLLLKHNVTVTQAFEFSETESITVHISVYKFLL